jgi:hypothetical protein
MTWTSPPGGLKETHHEEDNGHEEQENDFFEIFVSFVVQEGRFRYA